MTRKLMVAGIALLVVCARSGALSGWSPTGAVARAQGTAAESACGMGDLPAAYALHGSGRAAGLPFAMIGRVVFQADGKLSGANTEVWNGRVDHSTFTGTYSIDPTTCQGVATFVEKHEHPEIPNLHRVAFVVAADGQRAFATLTNNSYRQVGEAESPLPTDTITVSAVAERI